MEKTVKSLFTEEEWKILTENGTAKLFLLENLPMTLEKDKGEPSGGNKE